MRVLSAIVTSLVLIALVVGGGFLVVREALLQIAISQLTSNASQMGRIARNTGSYLQECQRKGSTSLGGSLVDAIQLRFISDTQYAVEVVCSQFSLDPLIVETNTLPAFVTKVPGSSGIKWQQAASAVSLQIWGRTRSIGISEEQVIVGLLPAETDLSLSPVTSCSGYGFTCCQPETTIGTGEQVAIAYDCPRSCYTQCLPRPVVLSVTTQPFLDQVSRTVTIGRGQEVNFGFVVDAAGLPGVTTTITYGDGAADTFATTNALAAHTYQCTTVVCQYQVSVSATSANGVSSADTVVTKLTVVVQ